VLEHHQPTNSNSNYNPHPFLCALFGIWHNVFQQFQGPLINNNHQSHDDHEQGCKWSRKHLQDDFFLLQSFTFETDKMLHKGETYEPLL